MTGRTCLAPDGRRTRYAVLQLLLFCFFLSGIPEAVAQSDVPSGYVQADDATTFLFDAAAYDVKPQRVVVTGIFRGWSSDMDDESWQLNRSSDGVWKLDVANPGYTIVPPNSEFKFRIDDGVWLDPPAAASNVRGGNLVFLMGIAAPRLRAEIRSPRAIWMSVSGDVVQAPLSIDDLRLEDAAGNNIPIEAILPNTASEFLVVPVGQMDIRRVYYLSLAGTPHRALCRRDPWFRTLYSTKTLGAEVSSDTTSTSFRLFAPRAERVSLLLYAKHDDSTEDALAVIDLIPDQNGVWEATVPANLHGTYYEYELAGPTDPGNAYGADHPIRVSDPYARVSIDSFGKSRVWEKSNASESEGRR